MFSFPADRSSSTLTPTEWWAAGLLLVICAALAIGSAATRAPYIDEAYYCLPAWNLAAHGSMGTPVLEPSGSPIPGHDVSLLRLREHSYWNTMPLSIILQASWFRLFGFTMLTMRLYTTVWAVALLAAWFLLAKWFAGSTRIGVLAVLLIPSDQLFIIRSGFGRMDMMSAALGFWGLELYTRFRERSLSRALFSGCSAVVAAALSHPNGGMLSLLGLTFLVFTLDRRRLRLSHLLPVTTPFVVGGLAMGYYILQDPQAFTAQFFRNSTGRLGALANLLSLVPREAMRYLSVYGLEPGGSPVSRIKLFVLVVYVVSLLYIWFNPGMRRRYATFAGLSAVYVFGLALLDNYRFPWYLVYIIPFFCAGTAIVAAKAAPLFGRLPIAALLAVLVCLQLAVVARLNWKDTYRNSYRPVIAFLQAHAKPGAVVMGNSELSFDYGLDHGLVDDLRLGYRTGIHPDLVVIEERYLAAWEYYRRAEPQVYAYATEYLRNRCHGDRLNPDFTVYVCEPNKPYANP